MIDSHAHLHDRAFDEDRDAVIRRAFDAGLENAITVGCTIEDSRNAVEVARRYGILASVGIHPHDAATAPKNVAQALAPLCNDACVVAIGETGLDFYYDRSPREAQERAFRAQIAVARESSLPVILHVRDAHERTREILREELLPGARGVVHCFTGNAIDARAYVEEFGFFLGIGGIVTFKDAAALRHAVVAVGAGSLLLETDCPYLAPVPVRGKRNEPAFMRFTLERVAQTLGMEPSLLEATTSHNTRALFQRRSNLSER